MYKRSNYALINGRACLEYFKQLSKHDKEEDDYFIEQEIKIENKKCERCLK